MVVFPPRPWVSRQPNAHFEEYHARRSTATGVVPASPSSIGGAARTAFDDGDQLFGVIFLKRSLYDVPEGWLVRETAAPFTFSAIAFFGFLISRLDLFWPLDMQTPEVKLRPYGPTERFARLGNY
jgi:hypothetical protein